MHTAPQSFDSRRVTEIVSEPLCKLMILQPANKTRVAIGAQDPPHERVFPVLMVDMGRLARLESFFADGTLAALVGIDPVIVFRG